MGSVQGMVGGRGDWRGEEVCVDAVRGDAAARRERGRQDDVSEGGEDEVAAEDCMPVPSQSIRNVGSVTTISVFPISGVTPGEGGRTISQLVGLLSSMCGSTSELRCHFWPVDWIDAVDRSESRSHRAE